MITMGVDMRRSRMAVLLAQEHPDVWAAVGHHPSETGDLDIEALRGLAAEPKVVAIGEVGLDFEEAGSPSRDAQVERLHQLFSLAVDLDLPVSIHNRGAATELVKLIAGHPGPVSYTHLRAHETR